MQFYKLTNTVTLIPHVDHYTEAQATVFRITAKDVFSIENINYIIKKFMPKAIYKDGVNITSLTNVKDVVFDLYVEQENGEIIKLIFEKY